ncbi:MAG: ATP-binding cassette domain-containing protein [Bdellovibrionales bacterium]|nr:ATP-binding cassette domain-containing protein [Bdellovibrionales bacterium]
MQNLYSKNRGLALFHDIFNRRFISVAALSSVSFNISEGEVTALLGPNGAGKTTIQKILAGLLSPHAGEVSVSGHRPEDREKEFLMKIGVVFGQKSQLIPRLTINDALALQRIIYEIPPRIASQRISNLSHMLDIKNYLDRPVRNLSLGQRMKGELMMALIHDPEVLLLDEPTVGLDLASQQTIREFIKTVAVEFKKSVLLTSHNMKDIEGVCSKVLVLNHGELIYSGDIQQLRRKYSNNLVDVSIQVEKAPDYSLLPGLTFDEDRLVISGTIGEKNIQDVLKFAASLKPISLRIEPSSLETVFLAATQ